MIKQLTRKEFMANINDMLDELHPIKELTDYEINLIAVKHMEVEGGIKDDLIPFVREILQKAREK